ncbi:MAG TPA: YggT family protein [Gammaproteobacteria bacterium]|nr:YggT family protein [Gammaproteobacteria bacterium]
MPTQINSALIFVIKTLSNLVLIVFILRLLLQWVRMDFHNPLSQFVFRATNPLVAPLQRIAPRSRIIDVPGAIVLIVVTAAVNFLLLGLYGFSATPLMFVYFVFARIVHLGVLIYLVSIIVVAVLSWFGQPGHHPVARALGQLVDPVLSRFRRFLPPFEGIDFSPLAAIICLYVVRILLPLPTALL